MRCFKRSSPIIDDLYERYRNIKGRSLLLKLCLGICRFVMTKIAAIFTADVVTGSDWRWGRLVR